MNDNDIIKALECCSSNRVGCPECPAYNYGSGQCVDEILQHAIDLINRQRTEIERLKAGEYRYIGETVQNARIEAIEDFAEKIKEERLAITNAYLSEFYFYKVIDRIVKEMTEGEQNEQS